jgi:hypothetical protein
MYIQSGTFRETILIEVLKNENCTYLLITEYTVNDEELVVAVMLRAALNIQVASE